MGKPVILTIDDDVQVSNAVERDLKKQYSREYRIIKSTSGPEALDIVQELKRRNEAVALFLADQRMPGMEGTEFLAEAMKLYPGAGKVLLTAYADTDAAITAINALGLDYYLMKPWDPPDQRLYPVIDDLLSDWNARAEAPFEGIRVAGTRWSPQSYAVKDFLSRNQVPYRWVDIEQDAPTRELIVAQAGDLSRLPVVFFPDGSTLVAPGTNELAAKAGLQTEASLPFYDVVIVGAGPAGLAAAVYAGSEGLHTLLVEQDAPGGQAGTSSRIENYLGFPSGVSGADLARRATTQARRFGVEVLTHEVVSVRRQDPYRVVRLADGKELSAKVLIWSTGVSVRKLEAGGIDRLLGIGVYYGAAMTEAATYRGRDVCVVGGANSAGQGALFFSRYARRVTMLLRASSLEKGMSRYLVDRIVAAENIDVLTCVEVASVSGGDSLESVTVRNLETHQERTMEFAAMFIFIGAAPRTELLSSLIRLDDKGYILTGPDIFQNGSRPQSWNVGRDPFLFETSVPGIFAVGDVRSGSGKRVAAAVGEGSAAVSAVHRYMETV